MADRTPVLRVDPDEVPERVLVMGDPARAELASRRLKGRRQLGSFREYVTYGGTHRGVEVAVTSHGVGAPGAVIAFEELSRAGVRRIIRTGTCGGLAAEVQDGDLVIVTGAIRADGVTDAMVPTPFPALASVDVVTAIRRAVASTDHRSHEGVVHTHSLFYPGEVLGSDLEFWHRAGAIAVEMECAALFISGSLNSLATGAVLVADGNPLHDEKGDYDPHRQVVYDAVEAMIDIGLDALIDG
ncbi:MAG: nucleoside phosphorylase [Acidimicrobiia bacterium]|nr:nucleoside phosphorylase [Acidimicrobiia bacterium]